MAKDTPEQLFKDILNTMAEATVKNQAAEKSLSILTKRLDLAIAEENWVEAEKVRYDVIEAFSTAVDLKIAMGRKVCDIQKRQRSFGL